MSTLKDLGVIELEMRIGLDTYHPKVRVTQYDSGLTLEYDIVGRNGEMVTSLPDVVPVLYVESPDKSAIGSAEGEIVDGKAVIPIPSSLLSKFGEAEAQVQLVNATTKEQIHDNTFILDIAQSKMDGEVKPGESLWFNLQDLKEAIAKVESLEMQYDNDVAAVSTMRDDVTSKHGEVTTMHGSLQDVYDTEADRVLAEKARADAENLRASAETTRVNNETKRVTAETGRVTAEEARATAESQRDTDEDARVANEVVRQTNEGVRISQENTRQTQESARQTLYQQLKALQEVLGIDPAVELANAVTDLQQAFDNLEVGGRNLRNKASTGGKHKIGLDSWINSNGSTYSSEAIDMSDEWGISSAFKITTTTGTSQTGIHRYIDGLMLGQLYTYSVYIKNTSNIPLELYFNGFMNPGTLSEIADAGESRRFVIHGFRRTTHSWFQLMVRPPAENIGEEYSFIVANEQLEKGNIATDWTPAPEDIYEEIALRLKTSDLKTEIQKIDGSGSGIDADLLDGKHATDFATSTHNHDGTYAPASHTHSIANVTGLQNALDGKSPTSHTHTDKLSITGGTMTGALVVQPSGNTRQARNIAIGTTAPTSTTGYSEGDIFLVVP